MNRQDLELEVGDRIYAAGALGVAGIPADPEPPYLLYIEDPGSQAREVSEVAYSTFRNFRFTAYDELGSYVRIERILEIVRETLLAMEGQVSPSGASCMGVWVSDFSGDIANSDKRLGSKFLSLRITSAKRG